MTLIRLANFTDQEINLRQNEVVGQFCPLSRTQAMVHSLDFEESDGESTQAKIGDPSNERTTPGSSEWLMELNIEKSAPTRDQELRFFTTIQDYEDVFSKNQSDLCFKSLNRT